MIVPTGHAEQTADQADHHTGQQSERDPSNEIQG